MSLVKDILLRDEGLSLRPYRCPAGFLTIGVGRNLEKVGITTEEAFFLLENDIKRATSEAEHFAWYHLLSPNRQAVVVCMIFNLGLNGFMNFRKTVQALAQGDYELAAKEMKDSLWAKQVGERSERLCEMMKEG